LRSHIRQFIKKVPFVGKAFVQRDELRAVVQKLWEPPGHFYSPIPALADIRRNEHRVFAASSREIPGIDLNESGQLGLFEELAPFYGEQPFSENRREGARYFFQNPAFSHCDAIVLYCMLRHARPRRVIEVGSGFSSCALLDTNERFFNHSIACTFIEPYPQLLTSLVKDGDHARMTLMARNLQDVDPRIFEELSPNDILFVDSSHVSKTDSDVNYVFFEILPRLRSGVYIHFHDIFYPFEYPKEWVYQGRAWNEAYILRSFLQYNTRFEIQFFNSFLERFHTDLIARAMPLCLRYSTHSMVQTSAQSLWLKKLQE
jgi:methyltransferase family protein